MNLNFFYFVVTLNLIVAVVLMKPPEKCKRGGKEYPDGCQVCKEDKGYDKCNNGNWQYHSCLPRVFCVAHISDDCKASCQDTVKWFYTTIINYLLHCSLKILYVSCFYSNKWDITNKTHVMLAIFTRKNTFLWLFPYLIKFNVAS